MNGSRALINQAYYHGEWVYQLAVFFTMISLLMFYLRIFPIQSVRIQVWVVMGAVSLYSALGILISINQCTPVRGAWEYWHGEEKFSCRNRNALGWASAIIKMVLDIAIIIVPIKPLAKLGLSMKKKVQVMLMFAVGLLYVGILACEFPLLMVCFSVSRWSVCCDCRVLSTSRIRTTPLGITKPWASGLRSRYTLAMCVHACQGYTHCSNISGQKSSGVRRIRLILTRWRASSRRGRIAQDCGLRSMTRRTLRTWTMHHPSSKAT